MVQILIHVHFTMLVLLYPCLFNYEQKILYLLIYNYNHYSSHRYAISQIQARTEGIDIQQVCTITNLTCCLMSNVKYILLLISYSVRVSQKTACSLQVRRNTTRVRGRSYKEKKVHISNMCCLNNHLTNTISFSIF